VTAAPARSFAFRPRYRGLAWGSMGFGGTVATVGAVLGFALVPIVTGVLGVVLGAAYLGSPTWKITVTVDDDGLTVGSPRHPRFYLAWSQVVRVVASPSTATCFIDGGAPERSLLVPGDGAPAPYDIADRKLLVSVVLDHVAADKVKLVSSLDAPEATEAAARPPGAGTPPPDAGSPPSA
jgi:hypothetical protein